MFKHVLSALAVTLFPFSSAYGGSDFDGVWDATVFFPGGRSAGVVRLETEGGVVSGTSEPLDENQFFPLSLSGDLDGDKAELVLSFRDDVVGRLSVKGAEQGFEGAGTLYGVPVSIVALASDRALRAPMGHDFNPQTYELQFESRSQAVLTLVPGDRVRTTLLDNEGQDDALDWKAMPGNTLTGPFFIENAMPGDMLVVKLHKVRLNRDTAKMYSRALNQAALQPGYEQTPAENWGRTWTFSEDRSEARIEATGSAIEGLTLPTRPMIGSIGVAPPLNTSLYAGDLWIHGGNIDYQRITEGTTLYIPVYRGGAYLSMGDGHALQGDGEISGQGLETSLDVEFEVDLIQGENLGQLWSEDSDYVMVHGIDRTLDAALQAATTGMSKWLRQTYELNDSEIAALLSSSIEYDIAVIVNSRPHIVAKLSKEVLRQISQKR
ncbi:MAG: acetamidase/formamidase family protein [Pseudomonadota bacterium]